MNKILIGVFLALLLITTTEIIYYFMFLNPGKHAPVSQSALAPNSTLSAHVTTPPPLQNSAYDPAVIESLKVLKKGLLTSSILTNTYSGTIESIENKTGNLNLYGTNDSAHVFTYKKVIAVQNAQQEQNTFYLRQSDLDKTEITSAQNPSAKLSFADLKKGDTVTIVEKIDLLKDWNDNEVSFIITKE